MYDETGLQFGKGSAQTGTGAQREQAEDLATIQVVPPNKIKEKKGHSLVVGGRVTGIHVNKGACQSHTHTHTHTHTACLSLSRHQRSKHR